MVQIFSGRIKSVRFASRDDQYYAFSLELDNDDEPEVDEETGLFSIKGFAVAETVMAAGNVLGLDVKTGDWIGLEGEWVEHPRFGRQIKITKAPVIRGPWKPDQAASALMNQGIDFAIAHQIKGHFKPSELTDALLDKDRVAQVPGITDGVAEIVVQCWRRNLAYFRAIEFLYDAGVPPAKIAGVWRQFGEDTERVLAEDPWSLVLVRGISFRVADEISRRMGLKTGNPNRIHGAILEASRKGRGEGHLYMTPSDILTSAAVFANPIDLSVFIDCLTRALDNKHLVGDTTTREGVKAVYEAWAYKAEIGAARKLHQRMSTAAIRSPDRDRYLEKMADYAQIGKPGANLREAAEASVEEWGRQTSLNLSPDQRRGVTNGLIEPVSVLTGLPGTGKTTSLKALVSILQDLGTPCLLVAPTGIAAQKMKDVTGVPAFTIHRAFAAKGGRDSRRDANFHGVVGDAEPAASGDQGGFEWPWGYSEDNPHTAQVLIVDESSMVDQHLLYRILDCTAEGCRLVFVGDAAQLPSVGPGNVLRDLVLCDYFPVVHLSEIFRQDEASGIILSAHEIHRGEVPDAKGNDFHLFEVPDEHAVKNLIVKIAERLFADRRNFQVLSPRHNHTVGVTNLNEALRASLNPPRPGLVELKGRTKRGKETTVLREDDRIMIFRNDYRLGIYNGNTGKIVRIDLKGRKIFVKIHDPSHDREIVLTTAQVIPSLIRLAYCCTVHKSQGLEYDVIVLPVVDSFGLQLQRNLLYTAVTRARKKVILVGTRSALAAAVANDKVDARNTLFPERLAALFG